MTNVDLLSAYPRLVDGPWRALSVSEQCEFLLRLELHLLHTDAPLLTRTHLFLETWAAPLPFYPEALLLSSRVERPDGAIGVLDVLLGCGVTLCLSGASKQIHDFNAGRLQPLAGTHPTVCQLIGHPQGRPLAGLEEPAVGLAYVRFFSGAIRAECGGFHVVESAEQLRRLGVLNPKLAAIVKPMRWCGPVEADEDGSAGWAIDAHVLHAGSLFAVQFRLLPGGQVDMVNDTALATEVGPTEVHQDLLRSIVLPAEPPSRRRGGCAGLAAAVQPTGRPSVPAHLVLSVHDPLLGRLLAPAPRASATGGGVPADGRVPVMADRG